MTVNDRWEWTEGPSEASQDVQKATLEVLKATLETQKKIAEHLCKLSSCVFIDKDGIEFFHTRPTVFDD